MPTEVRVLQPAEWDLLKQAPDGWVPDPAWVAAIVVMNAEELQGRACVCLMPHVEAVWIKPTAPIAEVAELLTKGVDDQAKRMGITKILAYGRPGSDVHMKRAGFKKSEFSVWEKEVCP